MDGATAEPGVFRDSVQARCVEPALGEHARRGDEQLLTGMCNRRMLDRKWTHL
jgi:hypothetical protein